MKKKSKIIVSVLGATALGTGIATAAVAQACGSNTTIPNNNNNDNPSQTLVREAMDELVNYNAIQLSTLSTSATTLLSAIQNFANRDEIQSIRFTATVFTTQNEDGTVNLTVGSDATGSNDFIVVFRSGVTTNIPSVWSSTGDNSFTINNITTNTDRNTLEVPTPNTNVINLAENTNATNSVSAIYSLSNSGTPNAGTPELLIWDEIIRTFQNNSTFTNATLVTIEIISSITQGRVVDGLIGASIITNLDGTQITIPAAGLDLDVDINDTNNPRQTISSSADMIINLVYGNGGTIITAATIDTTTPVFDVTQNILAINNVRDLSSSPSVSNEQTIIASLISTIESIDAGVTNVVITNITVDQTVNITATSVVNVATVTIPTDALSLTITATGGNGNTNYTNSSTAGLMLTVTFSTSSFGLIDSVTIPDMSQLVGS